MVELVADGYAFPEGPAVSPDGDVFLVDVQGGFVSKLRHGEPPQIAWRTGGAPNGLALHADGRLFVADSAHRSIITVDLHRGTQETLVDGFDGMALNGPNDVSFDTFGNLYFTDPKGTSERNPTGSVYRLGREGTLSEFMGGFAFPNGLCLNADGNVLYVAETMKHVIHECRIDPSGACSGSSIYAEVEGRPDGLAMDREGNLYVALFGSGVVAVVSSSTRETRNLQVHGSSPTNVAFFGSDLLVTETSTGTLQLMSIGIPGLPLYSGA